MEGGVVEAFSSRPQNELGSEESCSMTISRVRDGISLRAASDIGLRAGCTISVPAPQSLS